jgi:hypothetical protein
LLFGYTFTVDWLFCIRYRALPSRGHGNQPSGALTHGIGTSFAAYREGGTGVDVPDFRLLVSRHTDTLEWLFCIHYRDLLTRCNRPSAAAVHGLGSNYVVDFIRHIAHA